MNRLEKANRDTERLVRQLLAEQSTPERIADYADALYDAAARIYRRTILELAHEHGQADRQQVYLSREVREALRAETLRTAKLMVDSHNRDLRDWIKRNSPGKPNALLVAEAISWERRRRATHAQYAAQTIAYTAHADATLSFWRDAGLEPEFDFGGHGDAPPKCAICRALVETNPHPMVRVIEVGIPHPQCRQRWHTASKAELGGRTPLGRSVGGILNGRSTLIERAGGREQAAEAIRAMA